MMVLLSILFLAGLLLGLRCYGRFWNYAEHCGMLVPLSGEVAWLLADGPAPYWRGEVKTLDYEFARQEAFRR